MVKPHTISCVIPTHGRREKLCRLLDSLSSGTHVPDQTIVVANGCTDGTEVEVAHRFPAVEIVSVASSLGCCVARQIGASRATGDLLLFIDDDNVADKACVSSLVDVLDRCPPLTVVGPTMKRYPDGTGIWCSGAHVSPIGLVSHQHAVLEDAACPGATGPCDFLPNAFMVPRNLLSKVPFDPALFPHNWSEVDFGLRVHRVGGAVRVAIGAVVWHDTGYGGRTTRISPDAAFDQARARVLIRRRFPERGGSLRMFALVVFPASTIYYIYKFIQSGHFWQCFRAYLRGTAAGLRGDMLLPAPSEHAP